MNTPQAIDVAKFYDEFSRRLLRDYVYGNPRVEAAVNRVLGVIDDKTKSILDIGCGFGYSSAQYATHNQLVRVVGVDISPENINIANRLFGGERVQFAVSDLSENALRERFNVVAMLDVYEHIPRDEWPRFNAMIGELLTDDGSFVVTTPSPLHQDYLRQHDPAGLQIIDETVYTEDMMACAKALDATIVLYKLVSIWRRYDYLHVVMKRNPSLNSTSESIPPDLVRRKIAGLSRRLSALRRRGHVRAKLGMTV